MNISGVGFRDASGFSDFAEGVYDFEVVDGGGAVLGAIAGYRLTGGFIYTFYVANDGSLAVFRN